MVDFRERFVADLRGVEDHVADKAKLTVVFVGLDQLFARRQKRANGPVDQRLYRCRRRCKLVRGKDLTICIPDVNQVQIDLFKQPRQKTTEHGCVKGKPMLLMRHAILYLVQ